MGGEIWERLKMHRTCDQGHHKLSFREFRLTHDLCQLLRDLHAWGTRRNLQESKAVVIKAMQSTDENVRAAAVEALGKIFYLPGDERDRDLVNACLGDQSMLVRTAAIETLAAWQWKEVGWKCQGAPWAHMT